MTPIIEVKNLSKQYHIGQRQRYLSLRDALVDKFKFRQNNSKTLETDFWALNDISFDVQAGESIGIIGRNGAGKSTLLKILSRITPPTKGKAILRGRMASLLEVGTGFHPELTGRENVYFNASILGLRKAEVVQKFDEIVAFSGVEQFIDTPLKHYSSGMQLRLAFAVAAHLEPDILVIDEVLAVGDAEFQKKCLGKMDEVSKSGRTVLFVSHNISALKNICYRGIVLDKGKIILDNDIHIAVETYLSSNHTMDEAVRELPMRLESTLSLHVFELMFEEDLVIFKSEFHFTEKPMFNHFQLLVYDDAGVRVALVDLRSCLKQIVYKNNAAFLEVKMGKWQMVDGVYQLGMYLMTANHQHIVHQIRNIQVPSAFQELGLIPYHPAVRGFVEIKILSSE